MENCLILRRKDQKIGSYYRSDLIGDVLYHSFRYCDINITFAKKGRKKTTLSDSTALFLLENHLIEEGQYLSYLEAVSSLFTLETIHDYDSFSIEELYDFVIKLRREFFGSEVLDKAWLIKQGTPASFDLSGCLDQSERIQKLADESEAIIFALLEPELFALMESEISLALSKKKKIYLLVSRTKEHTLPCTNIIRSLLWRSESISFLSLEAGKINCDHALQQMINQKKASLFIYGEAGLLGCRNLLTDSAVFSIPKGYHACAVAGQLGLSHPAAVYIPAGYDITKTVPITEKTRVSYLHLAKLQKSFGDPIYTQTPEELYAQFPQFFLNVYESTADSGTKDNLPFKVSFDEASIDLGCFDQKKSDTLKEYLNSFPNTTFYASEFNENCLEGIKGKILVHGIKVKGSKNARVIPCGKKTSVRGKFREEGQKETGIASNFLFFLTPKLATLYNDLRRDRKEEMADVDTGHLDYLLEYRGGKRIESFPLFRKTCIAMKNTGEFIFFNFRLGGGRIFLNQVPLYWKKEDVDPADINAERSVCIFTPYSSLSDKEEDRETYRKAVGDSRLNIVIIQNRITTIRDGDVLLPGMGIVISLAKDQGEKLCKKLGLVNIGNGYFDPSGIQMDVKLDAPSEISEDDWSRIKWAYGGGLSLILNKEGLCDADHMEEWFDRDGWTSPLSRQTQESVLHTLVKHPRTAVGTTDKGELVILVFSGRTKHSDGADYDEMCLIARKLVPDIQNLMNVDGGGSAMLGMVHNGSFMELSLPSTSTDSTVGMVRPINTVLYIPLEK